MAWKQIGSPSGSFVMRWLDDGRLVSIDWSAEHQLDAVDGDVPPGWEKTIRSLELYLTLGEPLELPDWEHLVTEGWSPFQRAVYEVTTQIPHGESRSYAWVAERIRKPLASRAVGQALRKNPIPLLIPCHRVISSSGHVGGFMGECADHCAEMMLKRRLIDVEYCYRNPLFPFIARA